jgi:hypothetical protein
MLSLPKHLCRTAQIMRQKCFGKLSMTDVFLIARARLTNSQPFHS